MSYTLPHPLQGGRSYPAATVLRDLAAQESNDGEPYDTMQLLADILEAASPPQAETPGLDREAAIDRLKRVIHQGNYVTLRDYYLAREALTILAATAVSQPPTSDDGDWRDDPSADERWNAGLDYGLEQLCAWLDVDRDDVCWDAATETLDGDVQAVIGNILRRKFGDDFDFKAVVPVNVVDPAQPPTSRQGAGEVEDWRITAAKTIEAVASEWPADGQSYAKTLSAIFQNEAVLPAQPGPAPVGDEGAIEAVERPGLEGDRTPMNEYQLRETTKLALADNDRLEEKLRVLQAELAAARAVLDSIPAAGGKPSWLERSAKIAGELQPKIIDRMNGLGVAIQAERSPTGMGLRHMLFMASAIAAPDEYPEAGIDSDTKACRWLGYVQAMAVYEGVSSLGDEKERNRASAAPTQTARDD